MFEDAPLSEYSQVDRTGMPAINSAVITSKDAYNADSPAGDALGTYVPEIVANLTTLHSALDDDVLDPRVWSGLPHDVKRTVTGIFGGWPCPAYSRANPDARGGGLAPAVDKFA